MRRAFDAVLRLFLIASLLFNVGHIIVADLDAIEETRQVAYAILILVTLIWLKDD